MKRRVPGVEIPLPLPCPFCGQPPEIEPKDPEREGKAWGGVRCRNPVCHARPCVYDGIGIADERGPDAYKRAAVIRWNRRA